MVQSSDGDIRRVDLITVGRVAPRVWSLLLWRFVEAVCLGPIKRHRHEAHIYGARHNDRFFSHYNMPGF